MLDKIEKNLFYIFMLIIPLQMRKILYAPGWRFNEWLSMFVYLSDVVLMGLLILWFWRWLKSARQIRWRFSWLNGFLILFVLVSLLSVINAENIGLGIYQWLKLLELVALFFYVKNYALERFGLVKIFGWLIVSSLIQSVIATSQFLKQSDLGLRYLGESVLDPNMSGVAVFINFLGERVMRAYGTFPHPNILAGFLLVSIFALYYVWLYHKKDRKFDYWLMIAHAVLLWTLLLTFSRTIIFFWALGFVLRGIIMFSRKNIKEIFWAKLENRRRILIIFLSTIALCLIFSLVYWPEVLSRIKISSQDEAVQMRIYFAEESLKTGINILGNGLGNYIPWVIRQNPNLPTYYYQPVHNIFLLIYNETGLLGLITLCLFLVSLLGAYIKKFDIHKMYNYSFLILVSSVLAIGFFDHFLWTIQQGRIILWMTLGFLAAQVKES